MAQTPLDRYRADLAAGLLQKDTAQVRAVEHLEYLYGALLVSSARRRWWECLRPAVRRPVRGAYLWGAPGRGKTYLADSFFECLPLTQKRRVHFHRFMQEIHAELRALSSTPDPLRLIGKRMARQVRLLCLDELHIHDIADAMLFAGLLRSLFENGITLVATSNIPPSELYLDGLQRDRFLFAIDLIMTHTHVLHLNSPTDFRMAPLDGDGVWHVQDGDSGDCALDEHLHRVARDAIRYDEELVLNRRPVPLRARSGDIAWFRFGDLCEAPLWAADYLEIAQRFPTVLLSDIPRMDETKDNQAKRFMHLIDALYDQKVKLIATAQAVPEALYTGRYLRFAFERTVSRLMEMRGSRYLAKPHRLHGQQNAGA